MVSKMAPDQVRKVGKFGLTKQNQKYYICIWYIRLHLLHIFLIAM